MSSKVETIGRVSGDALDQIRENLKNSNLESRLDDPFKSSIFSVSSYFDVAVAARGQAREIFQIFENSFEPCLVSWISKVRSRISIVKNYLEGHFLGENYSRGPIVAP